MGDKNKINCIYCESKNIIKKGSKKLKKNKKQIYLCKNCNKRFVLSKLRGKRYNPRIILQAISYYNLGNTIRKTSKLINKRFKIKSQISTISNWLKEFSDICLYRKIRSKIMKNYDGVIKEKLFRHRGLTYNYKYHKAKLDFCNSKNLIKFLKNLDKNFPHKFFEEDQRCSQLKFNVNLQLKAKYNYACKLSKLSLKAAKTNKERHNVLENFILVNDKATIATEVPVWFWDKRKNIGICGHIDILQFRKNKIHILDYKPNADKENKSKVISQLYLYALALSFRTKMKLENFRCAWFDDKNYFEFNPVKIRCLQKPLYY